MGAARVAAQRPVQSACPTCSPPPPAQAAMRAADAAFVGQVLSTTVNADHGVRLEVTFHVRETWTSLVVTEMTVIDVPAEVVECGRRPGIGQTWMIYAHRDAEGRLALRPCGRSHQSDGDRDADAEMLGVGCPVRPLRLVFSPDTIRVGASFTMTLENSAGIRELRGVAADPTGAVVLDPPCPMPCRHLPQVGLAARVAGEVNIRVSAFGETRQCYHGGPAWNWVYPSANATLLVRLATLPVRQWLPMVTGAVAGRPVMPVVPAPTAMRYNAVLGCAALWGCWSSWGQVAEGR